MIIRRAVEFCCTGRRSTCSFQYLSFCFLSSECSSWNWCCTTVDWNGLWSVLPAQRISMRYSAFKRTSIATETRSFRRANCFIFCCCRSCLYLQSICPETLLDSSIQLFLTFWLNLLTVAELFIFLIIIICILICSCSLAQRWRVAVQFFIFTETNASFYFIWERYLLFPSVFWLQLKDWPIL